MKKLKSFIIILLIMGLSIAYLPSKVFADNPEYNEIIFQSNENHLITIGSTEGEIIIDNQRVNVTDVNNTSIGNVTVAEDRKSAKITVPKAIGFKVSSNTADKFDLFCMGSRLSYDAVFNSSITIAVQDHQDIPVLNPGNPGNPGMPAANATATITVTGGEGGFTTKEYDPMQKKDVERYVPYKESYIEARLSINNYGIELPREEVIPATTTMNEFRYNYSADDYKNTENEGKVRFNISSIFIYKYVGTIKINNTVFNVSDYINYTNRENWLDHYNNQEVSFDVFVDKADTYNIELNIEPSNENSCFIGNFLWTGDPNQEYQLDPDGKPIINPETGEKEKNDNYIGHSKLQLVKVEYERNGQKVVRDFTNQSTLDALNEGEREIGPGIYYQNYGDGDLEYGYQTKENNKSISYDDGSLVIPEGAVVTMRIVPEYGYQVTSFGINGSNIITGDNISEFSFKIEKGNFHLGAEVTKVDNKVKATSDNIKSGKVVIADNELDSGSALLSVKDTQVSDEKKSQFENALPEGYEIEGIEDISFAQVFYKGNENDVWSLNMEELENDATITLQLEDDIDPENTVLVHNIHDGEEFRKVDYTYNKSTKEMTFKEKSFSNFALAKKVEKEITTAEPEKTEPEKTEEIAENAESNDKGNSLKTGDQILNYISLLAVSTVVLVIAKKSKVKKISKH